MSVSIAVIVEYVPFINKDIFFTSPVPPIAFTAPVLMGIFLFMYEFIRRFLVKRGYFGGYPKININLVELVRTSGSFKKLK